MFRETLKPVKMQMCVCVCLLGNNKARKNVTIIPFLCQLKLSGAPNNACQVFFNHYQCIGGCHQYIEECLDDTQLVSHVE